MKTVQLTKSLGSACIGLALTACGGGSAPTPKSLVIQSSGAALTSAKAGDAILITVLEELSNGKLEELPPGTAVTFTGATTVTALDPASTAASPFPAPSASPTAIFIANPGRPDHATDLDKVLFILDAGSTPGGSFTLTATADGVSGSATIAVSAFPTGDATKGAALYGASGAACSACHGDTGSGSTANADGSFTIEGAKYDFPAPGLNAADGNVVADPDWNKPLFAIASRADLDNDGLTLREPMLNWLTVANPSNHTILTTQDYADIYAYLATQTR